MARLYWPRPVRLPISTLTVVRPTRLATIPRRRPSCSAASSIAGNKWAAGKTSTTDTVEGIYPAHKKTGLGGRFFYALRLGLQRRSVLGQVSRNTFGGSGHAFVAFFPVGRANFAVRFVELQSVNQTDQLFHVTAQRQVVDDLRADNAFVVDQERATESHATFGLYVVGLGDFVLHVCSHGVANLADTAIVHRGVAPGVVGEVRVDRNSDHFNIACLEVRHAVVQSDQLGRANKGEVQWVEEHQAVFAFDGRGQGEAVNDFAVAEYGRYGEVRGLLAYEYAHWISPGLLT